MNTLFESLKKFDSPTIANALEIVFGERQTTGFTTQTPLVANEKLPPMVGYARTAMIRSSTPFDAKTARKNLLAYYEYVAQPPQPTIAVIQDVDSRPGLGAFWGEVNTHVHWGLGCIGMVTNGSMRDLDVMQPNFQCLAATLSPSHAWVHVVEFGSKVDVLGMNVADGDIIHADRHGAVLIPAHTLEKLPAAIDFMARKEKVILDAAKSAGFTIDTLRAAMAAMDAVK
ncbi:MAG: RraA family protein [Burkholderiales bacterium]